VFQGKRKIQTKHKLPLLNWVSLPATQISGSVFNSLDDEKVIDQIDFETFEEKFKLIGKAPAVQTEGATSSPSRSLQNTSSQNTEASLIDAKRVQSVAITRKKISAPVEVLRQQISTMDLESFPLEQVEILLKILPNPDEIKKFDQFDKDKKNSKHLPPNDKFLYDLHHMERLKPRLQVMSYIGNLDEDLQLAIPQIDAVIAASKSLIASDSFKKILEVILAFGNYINSSKRGGVYGFKLQSLDILIEFRSPSDKKLTLLHYIAEILRKKFPLSLSVFNELNYFEKAGGVHLDLLGVDVREIAKGMKMATAELVNNKNNKKLKSFCLEFEPKVTKLEEDYQTAKDAFLEVVQYFGENPKLSQPNTTFPILQRFITALEKADIENVERLKREEMARKAAQRTAIQEEEEEGGVEVLQHVYDGAIDMLITELKSNAFKPKEYRKSRMILT
jgi:hypothetical protein